MNADERPVRGGRLRVVPGPVDLARSAAQVFTEAAGAAMRAQGRFSVALAGGSTPRALYEILACAPREGIPAIDWKRTHIFWGDERCVPPDHPDSNYRMAREALLDAVPVPATQVHRMRGEDEDPERAALQYESEMRASFAVPPPAIPRLDLVLLGLGEDAHTASLFPESPALGETERLVAAPYVAKLAAHRLTLTPPALNAAAQVVFLVSGKAKAAPLRDVLTGEWRPEARPAQCIHPDRGSVLWLVDADASSGLST